VTAAQGAEVPLLRVEGLVVRFGGEAMVDHVSLEVARGEIVTLVGPNGSGKTTLLRTALGLHPADGGRVHRAPGLRVGYVPQHLGLDPALPITVRRFITLTAGAGATAVGEALAAVGAPHLAESPMRSLSGGERRRALLARALVRRPGLLVLDEPTAGVDVGGQAEFYRLIDRIRHREGCGVLLVSHDLHLVMAATDRVVCINRHVCCSGAPEDITADPAYRALFGSELTPDLALYSHDHDHEHDLHGAVSGAGHGGGHAA
jgi:zinc transport system ATP-binding protein